MILQKGDHIYHDEHDVQIKVSNDNTKHIKVVSVTLRADLDKDTALDVMKLADKIYKEALGS